MMLVPRCDAAEAQHPREQALNVPAASVSTQRTAVLSLGLPGRVVRRNHLDATCGELRVETVAVVRAIADQPLRERRDEAGVEGVEDELRLMALTTRCPHGDRKAMAVCHGHDLGCLAASSDPNLKTPLFAPAWVPSMNVSVRSILPRRRKSSASAVRMASSTPSRSHFWKRSWHVWYGGYRAGMSAHGAPVLNTQRIPLSTSRGSRQGRPPRAVVRMRSGSGMLLRIASHCASVRSISELSPLFSADGNPLPEHGEISITWQSTRLSDAL